jgi:hypothetical protein
VCTEERKQKLELGKACLFVLLWVECQGEGEVAEQGDDAWGCQQAKGDDAWTNLPRTDDGTGLGQAAPAKSTVVQSCAHTVVYLLLITSGLRQVARRGIGWLGL